MNETTQKLIESLESIESFLDEHGNQMDEASLKTCQNKIENIMKRLEGFTE
ncbi:MAG: hypothetical protein RR565_08145 [Erysipelothrix sp.]